jgi:hypothetical protein
VAGRACNPARLYIFALVAVGLDLAALVTGLCLRCLPRKAVLAVFAGALRLSHAGATPGAAYGGGVEIDGGKKAIIPGGVDRAFSA